MPGRGDGELRAEGPDDGARRAAALPGRDPPVRGPGRGVPLRRRLPREPMDDDLREPGAHHGRRHFSVLMIQKDRLFRVASGALFWLSLSLAVSVGRGRYFSTEPYINTKFQRK